MKVAVGLVVLMLLGNTAYSVDPNDSRAVADQGGIQRAEVVGGSFFFKPDRVVVKVGVPVELTLRKEPGIVPHDFTLEAPEAGISIRETLGAEPKVIRFTPSKTGSFPFYCSKDLPMVKSHRERGMEGTLEVVE